MLRSNAIGLVAAFAMCTTSTPTLAFDGHGLFPQDQPSVQRCYGVAMVGMDSVINSRIGVPPEHALDLARVSKRTNVGDELFSTELLNNVLAAYLWNGTPHSYAIKVFYDCAQRQAPVRSAESTVESAVH